MTPLRSVALSPPGLILLAVTGMVYSSLVSCAVSEIAARIAAWLYSPDPDRRAIRREEWLNQLAEMKPRERPAQAGSMLWVGFKRAPTRVRLPRRPRRRTVLTVRLPKETRVEIVPVKGGEFRAHRAHRAKERVTLVLPDDEEPLTVQDLLDRGHRMVKL